MPLLLKHGSKIALDHRRLKLGQYLFQRHGGKIVFFGRFTAMLRAYAALLAGVNQFDARRFFLFNAAGGIAWMHGGHVGKPNGGGWLFFFGLGMVLLSMASWWRNVLKEGDEVTALILNVDRKTRGLQLSIKAKDSAEQQALAEKDRQRAEELKAQREAAEAAAENGDTGHGGFLCSNDS